jgi:hypothetical protein
MPGGRTGTGVAELVIRVVGPSPTASDLSSHSLLSLERRERERERESLVYTFIFFGGMGSLQAFQS